MDEKHFDNWHAKGHTTDMKTLIAIISYNEERNLERVFGDLKKHQEELGYDIVLIDNGSSDGSISVAESNSVDYVQHCINTGSAPGTVRAYFQYAWRNDYDILVQFDGDGQHNASTIKDLIQPIQEGKADYVIGSRFLQQEGFKSYHIRRIGIRLLSAIARIFTGYNFTDITSGARAYSSKVIKFIATQYPHQMYGTLHLTLLCSYANAVFQEVPVIMNARSHGKSGFTFGTSISYVAKSLINCVGFLIKYGLRGKHGIKS